MSMLSVFARTLSALLVSLGGAGDEDGRHGGGGRTWPVPGADGGDRPLVVRRWEPPATPWGPGHRGVDLATVARAPVRAVAAGRVAFAGPVAGRGVVTVELAAPAGQPPLRVTYEPVRPTVSVGQRVAAGEVVGRLAPGPYHCRGPCLHWGLRRGEEYRDPLSLLPPDLVGHGPSRLLPVTGVPLPDTARYRPDEELPPRPGSHPPLPAVGAAGDRDVRRLSRPRRRAWHAAGAPTWCGSG